ncbi:uncharacterized protein PHACADRAFT_92835, partial [Phanerochaete carnosa HHB-10118-sp]
MNDSGDDSDLLNPSNPALVSFVRISRHAKRADILSQVENVGWHFELEGTPVAVSCEGPPWQSVANGTTVIPTALEHRVKWSGDSYTTSEENRLNLWGTVQLAKSGRVSEKLLFRSQDADNGISFPLKPPRRSEVPLQRLHVGRGAIPNALADVPCDLLSVADLLAKLNDVLGTSYPLGTPGLRDCLEYAASTSNDFGEVYGTLRPQWSIRQPGSNDFVTVLARMKDRHDEDQRRRENAVRDHSIQDSQIPPRRVWDLYSNRVLPFHVVPWENNEDSSCLPADLWAVSHTWVHGRGRILVMTPINGRRWPVSLPRGTSLDHIRIELLNMGAKYVWVDVLCLWLEGNADDDKARLEEWKLDVPTVGHVYQAYPRGRPCITYFNGLGLPFNASPTVLKSDDHWFNHLWTLQETSSSWLPGGLTAAPLPDSRNFFTRLQDLISNMSRWDHFADIVQAVRGRYCPTDHGKMSCLAYLLQCTTLPLYNRSISLETAWTLLIKHMPARNRTSLFLQHESDALFGLWTSWSGLLASPPSLLLSNRTLDAEELRLVDPQQVHTDEPGEYYHTGCVTKPCRIVSSPNDTRRNTGGPQAFQLHFYDHAEPITVEVSATETHGYLVPDVPYHFVGVGHPWKDCWVAVEVVGERDVLGEKALEVIKWGVIHMDEDEGQKFVGLGLGEDSTRVTYLWGEKALGRSGHVDKYITA